MVACSVSDIFGHHHSFCLRKAATAALPVPRRSHSIPKMPFFFLFLLLLRLSCATLSLSYVPPPLSVNRRFLHHPFFPLGSFPPSQPPSLPPSLPPPQPKYPFSAFTPPFFPVYPSPPPPPPSVSTLPTFPANISSIVFPKSPSQRPKSPKLTIAVLLPVLFVALLASLAAFFFLYRRRRNIAKKSSRADSHRLFPANAAPSDSPKADDDMGVPPISSEFLYLGTLVNSRGPDGEGGSCNAAAGSSPYQKLDSPELRPLPPLGRQSLSQQQHGRGAGMGAGGEREDEDFYSPKGSSGEREGLGGVGSSSRRVMPSPAAAAAPGRRGSESRSSNSSTLSYPTSNSASPTLSSNSNSPSRPSTLSPERLKTKSQVSGSVTGGSIVDNVECVQAPPPPPPPPPPRPMTPSPPKRKPPSPSPPLSPPDEYLDSSMIRSRPPAQMGGFSSYAFTSLPPPPPPPPAGFWDGCIPSHPPASEPPPVGGMEGKNATLVPEAALLVNSRGSGRNEDNMKPKLKPLHWDKVRASSDREMVWDQLRSSSFQLNEEMIEALFVCNATNPKLNEMARRPDLPSVNQENRILDPKKSQNIAILLRALNVTKEEVCDALLEGNACSLGSELLETLLKMAPTKEEEFKLREYKDDSPFRPGPAENFLKVVLDVPFAFKRMDAMLYMVNFDSEINYLKNSFKTLEAACEELRSSRMFLKLLEAVLKTGNRMNIGTNRGDARAFKLDTLLKLVDVKGTDGKTTLLHFVVQEIIKSEGKRLAIANLVHPSGNMHQPALQDDFEIRKLGLQVVSGLSNDLSNVKKAAAMDADMLSTYVSKLAAGIGKITEVIRLNNSASLQSSQKFFQVMNGFLKKAEGEIIKIQAQESVALSLVKEITEYFHGNSAREEAHPFRLFIVVRDFLSILDKVCKEVGRTNEGTFISSARQFPVPVNPTLPQNFPTLNSQRQHSSDDDSDDSSLSP